MAEPTKIKAAGTKATSAPVFDVTPPGKAVPSANARPVIVSRTAIATDPMVTALPSQEQKDVTRHAFLAPMDNKETDAVATYPEQLPESATNKTEGQDSDKTPVKDASVADVTTEKAVGETTEPEVEPAPVASKPLVHEANHIAPLAPHVDDQVGEPEPEEEQEDPDSDETAGRAAMKRAKKAEEDEERERMAAAQALIESKQYNVPIKARRQNRVWVWAGIVFLVVAGAAAGYAYLVITQ